MLQQGRQLIPRQQPRGSGRGPSSAAALKEGSAAERQAAPDAPPTAPQQAGAQPPAEQQQQEEQQQDSAGVRAALAALRFYKAAISPLLPPACRFLPTCSGALRRTLRRAPGRNEWGQSCAHWLHPACSNHSPLQPFPPPAPVYSMDAFKQFGVGKGFVLTAWRLLRCTPWGNSG